MALTREQKIERIQLLEEKLRRQRRNRARNFKPYEWQRRFYAAGAKHAQRLMMAANRVGKTFSAAQEFAYHVTGRYPEWWEGRRFASPIKAWALGVTGEQIRDVIQKELLGEWDQDADQPSGEGAIPYSDIIFASLIRSPQTKQLVKDIQVRHVSGGISSISLKAYSQGQHVMMGPSIDLIWIDEEPTDPDIYPQCLTRTATGDGGKGGIVMMTFTPENGMTLLVAQFMEELKAGQYLQNVTWDDAPHLDEATKAQLLDAFPTHQREMRTKGIPAVGSGLIYTIDDALITCDPFEIPSNWFIINGCDFGWDHPQAHVQLAIDRDADEVYVTKAWRESHRDAAQAWTAVKGWARKFPVAWPHDGLQHEKGGGEVLKDQYEEAGFNMLHEHATWPDGGNSVETGVWELNNRMKDRTFKVFKTCSEVLEEKRLYHRDKNGKIVKERDDLLSAIRYAYMMRRFAEPNRAPEPVASYTIPPTRHFWNK